MSVDAVVVQRTPDGRLDVVAAPAYTVMEPQVLASPLLTVLVHVGPSHVYRITGADPNGNLTATRITPDPALDEQCPTCADRIGNHTHADLRGGQCRRALRGDPS